MPVDILQLLDGVTDISKIGLHAENFHYLQHVPENKHFELNNNQRKNFRKALLEAYPNYSDLKIFVSEEFGEELSSIVGETNNMKEITFELIKWAIANGKIETLIAKAYNDSDNQFLKEFYEEIM